MPQLRSCPLLSPTVPTNPSALTCHSNLSPILPYLVLFHLPSFLATTLHLLVQSFCRKESLYLMVISSPGKRSVSAWIAKTGTART